jgi:hypothetical protein
MKVKEERMPVIRITDATWERLKRWAIPLEDTPEDALRKVLDAAEGRMTIQEKPEPPIIKRTSEKTEEQSTKLHRGQKTPNPTYRRPILEALHELGGSASADEVLNEVEKKVRSILTDVDLQKLPSGVDTRWRNAAQWVRFALVKEGLLKSDSPRGIWEITAKGEEELAK